MQGTAFSLRRSPPAEPAPYQPAPFCLGCPLGTARNPVRRLSLLPPCIPLPLAVSLTPPVPLSPLSRALHRFILAPSNRRETRRATIKAARHPRFPLLDPPSRHRAVRAKMSSGISASTHLSRSKIARAPALMKLLSDRRAVTLRLPTLRAVDQLVNPPLLPANTRETF